MLVSSFEMGHEIRGFASPSNRPSNLASRDRQGVDQNSSAMADVLMFATLATARLSRFCGGFALAHLHTGFFIAADQQAALFVGFKRFGIKLTNVLGLSIKVFVMTIQPVFAFVRLEIDILKNPLDA